jgi:hypothetical protein
MKRLFVIPLLLSVIFLAGCPPEKDARDAIAAAHGVITAAQAQWTTTCRAQPTQAKCQAVNKLIQAQHLAADALTTYCGGVPPTGTPTYLDGGPCTPVTSAGGALRSAIQNMNSIVNDVNGLLKGGA